ncbi:MAG TPA: ATP-binding protein [Galbitalea sp.]|jgi:signal transduction histidine kinase|nr:ATP-binding protein [Galbitalea sp.]
MQGQTQHVGLLAVNRAFSRFAHVTGYACLCGAILEVIGYQADAPSALIWPVLLLLATTLALLVFLDRWRTGPYSVLFLIVGGVSQYWLSVSLLAAFPSVRMSHTLILSLVSVSLVLVCGPGFVPSSTIIWGTVGFAIGQAASVAAALTTGSPFRVDAIAIVVEVGLVLVELTDAVTRSRRLAVRPELDRAVIDDELSVLRYRTEVRAAALMHDTVLGHLSAIAAGSDGALQPRLRSEIEKDLAVLIGEEWLNDPTPAPDDPSRSDWRRSALLSAVQEARDLSLTVDVTGDPGAIGRLTAERDVAVGLAAKQCLVNVLRHAQVDRAEVVVIGSRTDVSIMVIDAGRGFSEQLVASDRLGLRQSVRRRIENVGGEVQLWSTPGRGTSVLIRVPAESAVGSSNE